MFSHLPHAIPYVSRRAKHFGLGRRRLGRVVMDNGRLRPNADQFIFHRQTGDDGRALLLQSLLERAEQRVADDMPRDADVNDHHNGPPKYDDYAGKATAPNDNDNRHQATTHHNDDSKGAAHHDDNRAPSTTDHDHDSPAVQEAPQEVPE